VSGEGRVSDAKNGRSVSVGRCTVALDGFHSIRYVLFSIPSISVSLPTASDAMRHSRGRVSRAFTWGRDD